MTSGPRLVYTIGYESKTQAELIAELEAAGVRRVIDVRAVAASRRPGFSKTILAASLKARGIDYLHLRALGTPKAGRDAARKGEVSLMRDIYSDQLATPEAALALEQAQEAAAEAPCALLCFERDARGCHRAMIAERLAERGFGAVDL